MPIIPSPNDVRVGADQVEAIYAGNVKVWAAHVWTPKDITGLGFWIDAQQITGLSDGAAVTTWHDCSGSGFDVVAEGTPLATYRAAAVNGCPAVEFVGDVSSGTTMRITGWGTALAGKTDYTLFVVANNRQTAGNVPVILVAPYRNNAWQWLVEYDTNGGLFWGHVGYRRYDAGIPDGSPCLLTLHFPHEPHFYVDSTEITDYVTYSGDLQPSIMPIEYIGSDVQFGTYNTPPGYGVDGDVAEILWYDHALTDPERVQIETYLKAKWGL